jgi:hypothetical protein
VLGIWDGVCDSVVILILVDFHWGFVGVTGAGAVACVVGEVLTRGCAWRDESLASALDSGDARQQSASA